MVLFRYKYGFMLILFALLFYGCNQEKRELHNMYKLLCENEIFIPNDMLRIQNGQVFQYQVSHDLPVMIEYVGPEECSDCFISHIDDYLPLAHLCMTKSSLEYMIIVSPSQEDMNRILDKLVYHKIELPVYLDVNSSFHDMNLVPLDTRLHCFLISPDHYPIFVGNPFSSEKLMTLFNQKIAHYEN